MRREVGLSAIAISTSGTLANSVQSLADNIGRGQTIDVPANLAKRKSVCQCGRVGRNVYLADAPCRKMLLYLPGGKGGRKIAGEQCRD